MTEEIAPDQARSHPNLEHNSGTQPAGESQNSRKGSRPKVFETEQEELLNWPYSVNAIDNTLDADLISGQGKQLLFQALDNESVVAFIGAGISQAYGRLSWSDWLNRQLDEICETAEVFLACTVAAGNLLSALQEHKEVASDPTLKRFFELKSTEITFHRAEINKLHKTVRALAQKDGARAEIDHPITFQATDELHALLIDKQRVFVHDGKLRNPEEDEVPPDAPAGFAIEPPGAAGDDWREKLTKLAEKGADLPHFREYFKAHAAYVARLRRTKHVKTFADFAKYLLMDECAHAEQMLTDSFRMEASYGRSTEPENRHALNWSTKNIPSHGDRILSVALNPDRYRALAFFKKPALRYALHRRPDPGAGKLR